MITYADRTFCSSANCKNECGRQLTAWDRERARKMGMPIAYAQFCDKPKAEDKKTK